MTTLPLGYDDFRLVARLCRAIAVCRLPDGFDFRGFLIRVLRPVAPSAARSVEALTAAEVGTLRAEVAEYQALAT